MAGEAQIKEQRHNLRLHKNTISPRKSTIFWNVTDVSEEYTASTFMAKKTNKFWEEPIAYFP
jgi:hypothetical protein